MSLFHFGKKKEEKKKSCCCIEKNCTSAPVTPSTNGKITSIQVLGAGCKSCHEQYENTKKAVQQMGISVEVEYYQYGKDNGLRCNAYACYCCQWTSCFYGQSVKNRRCRKAAS